MVGEQVSEKFSDFLLAKEGIKSRNAGYVIGLEVLTNTDSTNNIFQMNSVLNVIARR